jgi:hypothetical protein
LRLCNAARTGWELFATCESAAHCDAGRRQCQPTPCEPGARRCNVGNLERCNDDRTGWELLDACVTNELCEATLAPAAVVGEVLSTSDLAVPTPASDAQGPTECRVPVCVPREVRCDLNRLNACNEGQTALTLAEECATPRLCEASITYTGLRGSPRCVRPVCAPGEHRCSDVGVLELCNSERDGFDPIEACIGPQFCNAVAADNGEPGCEEAPCEAGEQQCNGPQIQQCSDDRTDFVELVAPCETSGLCNDDGDVAFCAQAACRRGPLSGTEFRCVGATLERCNDQHTGYDPLNTCATAGLCNAGLGFNGCLTPVCAPGETRCSGNFVQRCNPARTGFENVEQCAAGTCDSQAGRCADPCVQGSARCNAQGNLEECRNLLVGREITARCGSVQLCDANTRSCRTPPAGCTADGVRRCAPAGQGSVLEQCSDGRSRFVTLDTCEAGQVCDANDITCDECVQGSEPTCQGNSLVSCSANGKEENVTPCPNGCQTVAAGPDRCRSCVPGSTRCENDQLVVCRQDGSEEVLVREFCDSAEICQNTLAACNAAGSGENCRCQACVPSDRGCEGTQPVACNADRSAIVPVGPDCGTRGCNDQSGACFACAPGDISCVNGSLFGCNVQRTGFTEPLGARQGVESNGSVRALSCSGSTLVTDACESEICNPASGCAECNSAPGQFQSECRGETAHTVCQGGQIEEEACNGGACREATCDADDGTCGTRAIESGEPCVGVAGVCDGSGTCVECLPGDPSACSGRNDPRNPCVVFACLGNRCQETFPEVACGDGGRGTCSEGECQVPECDPEACDDLDETCRDFECVNDQCVATNLDVACGDGLRCSGGSCLCDATACDARNSANAPCVDFQCTSPTTCGQTFPTTGCAGGGTCSDGVCQPPACVDAIACTIERINEVGVCEHQPDASQCDDDGNPCNGTAVCSPTSGCGTSPPPAPLSQCPLGGGVNGVCVGDTCQAACSNAACAQLDTDCRVFTCGQNNQCQEGLRQGRCAFNPGVCINGECDLDDPPPGNGNGNGNNGGVGGNGQNGGDGQNGGNGQNGGGDGQNGGAGQNGGGDGQNGGGDGQNGGGDGQNGGNGNNGGVGGNGQNGGGDGQNGGDGQSGGNGGDPSTGNDGTPPPVEQPPPPVEQPPPPVEQPPPPVEQPPPPVEQPPPPVEQPPPPDDPDSSEPNDSTDPNAAG